MIDFKQQYALWDEFLHLWPLERLATMTLDEYSLSGSKDTFTYWLEFRLNEKGLGSIAGGSAFKFGVFSRKDSEKKNSTDEINYSDTHAWYSSFGTTAHEAFLRVRELIIQIAHYAAKGDIAEIEALPSFWSVTKWKIAFLYQNRQTPMMVGVLTKPPLEAFLTNKEKSIVGLKDGMANLQQSIMALRPNNLDILEFGRLIWEDWSNREDWSKKNIEIWKLSHGDGTSNFTESERQQYLEKQVVAMYQETGKSQGKKFMDAPIGTVFYLCHGNSTQLIGQFISDPEPCDKANGWIQRHYRLIKKAIQSTPYKTKGKNWSPSGRSTFWKVPPDDLTEFEQTLLKPFFDIDLALLAEYVGEPIDALSIPLASNTSVVKAITANKPVVMAPINRIYYGPPGTGKTYKLEQLLKQNYEQTIQSLSPEDWRNQIITEKVATLKWWEGTVAALYELGGKAKVADIAEHPFIKAISSANSTNRNVRQTLWSVLQSHTIDDSSTVKVKRRMSPSLFDKSTDSVWQFAGDWQEVCEDLIKLVDEIKAGPQNEGTVKRYSFVTFHQSYGYEEFIEGLRPVLNSETDTESGADIQYEMRSGVFKELCRKARQAPDQRFAMVIDEINRGNISKIFGELITMIEVDKRDPLDGNPPRFEVTLAYSGEHFSVPANVDIIGAMNTADRSLALLDTALRRRFDFVPLLPDTRGEKDPENPDSAPLAGLVVTLSGQTIDVCQMLAQINKRIETLYDRDHCIGHAYFTDLDQEKNEQVRFDLLATIFRNRILPLLEEYFFEDLQKIRLVLADNQKQDESTKFVIESMGHEEDLAHLFGNNHGLDSYETKRRYIIQEDAFKNPAAYIGIYNS